jgi:hypothetical protein
MSTYNPDQKSVPKTDSTPASSSDSQQKTPEAKGSVATSTSLGSSTSSTTTDASVGITLGSMMTISVSLIAHLIFSYGAAKLSYDMFGSVGWAILDFIFSWFYYPYYALFLNKSSPALGIVGARRRR